MAKKTSAKPAAKKTAAKGAGKPTAAPKANAKPTAKVTATTTPSKPKASEKKATPVTKSAPKADKPSDKKSDKKGDQKAPAKKTDKKAAGKPDTKKAETAAPKGKAESARKTEPKSEKKPTPAKAEAKSEKTKAEPRKPAKADTKVLEAKPQKKSDKKPKVAPDPEPSDLDADDVIDLDDGDASKDKKAARKNITVVEQGKKPAPKSKPVSKYNPPVRPMLLGPGSKFNKPLIPSGPSAPKITSLADAPKSKRTKSPLTKAKLDKYRALLIAKRAELLGDVVSMEHEALRSESGGLSNTPQHIAEQGSESYDQSLSLNLAAQDRRVIKEIDEALKRIDDGVYGLCELTNQPIPEERLDEIPWARYTIEAARELETRGPLS